MTKGLSRWVALLLFLPAASFGWGGFTHQRISHLALRELAETVPGARVVLENRKLLEAFLGGSMGPDMALNFLTSEPDMPLHRLLHQRDFADALVAVSEPDVQALAKAMGWKAHVLADDSGAHGPNGYANQKKTFEGSLAKQNHTVAEAMLDILTLEEQGPHNMPVAFDEGYLAQAADLLGEDVDQKRFQKMGKKFRNEVRVTETLFLAVAKQRKPLLLSARSFYQDAEEGLVEGRGMARAVQEVVQGLAPHFEAFHQEEPTLHWWDGLAIGQHTQSATGIVGAGVARIKGIGKLTQLALDGLDEIGVVRKTASVDFFRSVLVTREVAFEVFVRDFEKSFEAKAEGASQD